MTVEPPPPRRASRRSRPCRTACCGSRRSIVHHANKVREDAVGREGRRPPGVVGVDGLDHDRALLRPPARARPRVGQAARVAGAARDRVPARPARPALPHHAARVRRAAELPEPPQGPGARPTSRPARSASARRRRSGARSPTATSPGHFEVPQGGRAGRAARRRRARRGRDLGGASSTRSCRSSARCCGSSTSTASRSTASCPTSPPAGSPAMFEAAGWHTITVKYGRRLRELFDATRRRGAARGASTRCRTRSTSGCCARSRPSCASGCRVGRGTRASRSCIADLDDDELLRRDPRPRRPRPRRPARRVRRGRRGHRPPVGRCSPTRSRRGGLPTEGHPGQPLGAADRRAVGAARRRRSAPTPPTRGRASRTGSPEAELCRAAAERLRATSVPILRAAPAVPGDVGRTHTGTASTQQAFGRFFVDLSHAAPEVAAHVVTVSPDVASSTNLGGWINRVGHLAPRRPDRLVRRRHRHARALARDRARPAHRARDRRGQPRRAARRAGRRRGRATASRCCRSARSTTRSSTARSSRGRSACTRAAQSILVGTPSGVTLAPEGGAHQSIITPSVGLEQPRCIAWEPAFGQDLEWTLLHALSRLGRPGGTSSYFRLTTRPIDQALAARARGPGGARAAAPRRSLAGGYALREAAGAPAGRRWSGWARSCPRLLAAADELDGGGHRMPTSSASRRPTSSSARCRRAQGLGRRRRRDPRRAVPRRTAPRRSSPCSTAIRTR